MKSKTILSEGGAGDHMKHPFDLDVVKNGKGLKDWFDLAIDHLNDENIEKKPTVKIDGVNLSFKVITTASGEKEFAVDRGSLKQIDRMGVTGNNAEERFPPNPNTGEPHGMIAATKVLLTIFNEALSSIAPELERLNMLNDSTFYFNTEYVLKGTESTNVLQYEENSIFIHGLKRFYNRYDKKGSPLPGRAGAGALDRPKVPVFDKEGNPALDKTGKQKLKEVQKTGYNVAYDRDALESLKNKVNETAPKHGFKVYTFISPTHKEEVILSSSILDKALNIPFPVRYTEHVDQKTLGQRLFEIQKNPKDVLISFAGKTHRDAMLKEVYLAVLGGKVPIDQLTEDETHQQLAIDGAVMWHATRVMGDAILNMLTTKKHGDMSRHEGIVLNDPERFGTDEDVKISGGFIVAGLASSYQASPINEQDEQSEDITYVFIPGGFKPPHKGHISLVQQSREQNEEANIVIMSGKEERGGTEEEALISWEQAKNVFGILLNSVGFEIGGGSGQVQVDYFDQIDTGKLTKAGKPIVTRSPIHRIGQFTQELRPGAEITIVSSKADAKYGEIFEKVISHYNDNVRIKTVALNTADIKKGEKISATAIRKTIKQGDFDSFRHFYPEEISDNKLLEIFNILGGDTNPEEDDMSEAVKQIDDIVEETLEEMSAMGMGSVGGYAQRTQPGNEEEVEEEEKLREYVSSLLEFKFDTKVQIIREQRDHVSKLRSSIRKLIEFKYKELLMEEDRLRGVVKKAIKISEGSDIDPHPITAINFLRRFFDENSHVIEDNYADLGTSREQRESYTLHLLNAIKNKLQIDSIFDNIARFVKQKIGDVEAGGSQFAASPVELGKLTEQKGGVSMSIGDDGLLQKEKTKEEEKEDVAFEKESKENKGYPSEPIQGLDATGWDVAKIPYKALIDNLTRYRDLLKSSDLVPLDPSDPNSPKMTEKDIFDYYLFLNLVQLTRIYEEEHFSGPGEDVRAMQQAGDDVEKSSELSIDRHAPEKKEEPLETPEEEEPLEPETEEK